jgi:Flp pilus assembly protein TadG
MGPLKLLRSFMSETGAELVEFALSIPVLMLITMGIIDFGLLFQRYEVLTNASREGARISVLPDYGPADIEARVNQYLQGTSLTSATVTTTIGTPQTLQVGGGSCITVTPVTVSYTHQFLFVGGIMSYLGSSLGTQTVSATTSMRSEIAAASCP